MSTTDNLSLKRPRLTPALLLSRAYATDINSYPPPPDGGWGWVVVVAGFTVLCVVDGVSYAFGVLLASLKEDMKCDLGSIKAVGSLQIASYALTSLVTARLVTK